ncbi:MAG: hypothetical protein ACR2HG_01020 [Pyrinomonadaceae bacterium]
MSIIKKRFSRAAIIFAEILICAFAVFSQDIEADVKITPDSNARVEGKLLKETINQSNGNWSFTQALAGAENLGARISDLSLSDKQNRTVSVKKLIDGEYLASEKADAFQYRINLNQPPNAKTMAHVSWLSGEQGILMLGDLLPQFAADNQTISARIKFDLPIGWKIISSEKSSGENIYDVKNIEKAIFVVGKNWRESETPNCDLAISGEWQFTDAEAAKMAGEIFERYRKLFGDAPTDKARIFLIRLPKETKFGRWEAETRGANTTIVSSDMPFKTLSLQLLHEQLRHEIFHLWIPNRLALTGNYDWFYEGFTVYQALRTGVAANQIRFEDFLDTLAEAYNLDSFQTRKISLVESSKNRWSGANPQIYARGMLVAFLCDAAILQASKGKNSIEDIFREVYRKHRVPNEPADGNAAILEILKTRAELIPIVENYIRGTEKINLEKDLEAFGIAATEENSFVKLGVKTKLSGGQKDLLDKLGYNNWRNISGKSK